MRGADAPLANALPVFTLTLPSPLKGEGISYGFFRYCREGGKMGILRQAQDERRGIGGILTSLCFLE